VVACQCRLFCSTPSFSQRITDVEESYEFYDVCVSIADSIFVTVLLRFDIGLWVGGFVNGLRSCYRNLCCLNLVCRIFVAKLGAGTPFLLVQFMLAA
jgi:hypothetical protein